VGSGLRGAGTAAPAPGASRLSPVFGKGPGSGNGWQEARATRERERMVEEQLVRRGIADARVLEAMRKVPRHRFVEEALRDRAYGDHPLPIGEGQTISQPYMVAAMSQLLGLQGTEKVLEIGSGSGYQTAVLAELTRRICSIERLPALAARARRILEELGYTNAVIRTGDGTYGWPDEAPFDRILVTAGAPAVPGPLFQQLAEKGRMVVPIGEAQSQLLHVVDKVDGQMRTSTDCGCVFVKLVGRYGWED
jgi:protein-L-isoaspartate(D-aspartate) O-methyltransferase